MGRKTVAPRLVALGAVLVVLGTAGCSGGSAGGSSSAEGGGVKTVVALSQR
jgi:hypothetical protein